MARGGPDGEGPGRVVTIRLQELQGAETDRRVAARPGEPLTVRLESNLGTGYRWLDEVAEAEGVLKPLGKPEYESPGDVPSPPGAPRFKAYRFEVLKPGTVEFELSRPIDRDPEQRKQNRRLLRLEIVTG